jgi:hypothetical protein
MTHTSLVQTQAHQPSTVFAGYFGVDKILSRLKSEVIPSKPSRVHNILLEFSAVTLGNTRTYQSLPVRVVVEEYASTKEFIAYWTENRTFSGYGSSIEDALSELADNLLHDFVFYAGKKEKELTTDAREVKRSLQSIVKIKP